jgi:predicted AlkP superfamily phosphohydrolase/phosphomutase
LTSTGEAVDVALAFELYVPPGSSRQLYERFSEDFYAAVRRLIKAAAEIEAAGVPTAVDRHVYVEAVANNVRGELAGLGVTVTAYSMPVWGSDRVPAARAEAGVADQPPCKLVVLGVDGGDWLNLRPLIESGRLPNFERLVREGASGPLRSIEPMLSPLLWTTMATGKYPEDHGILNFTVVDPESGKKVPITRHYRQVDAFWNMLSDYGRRVAVVGWLATHPAERVNGVMVTDKIGYLAFAPHDGKQQAAGTVFPDARSAEISRLVVRGAQVPYEECESVIHIDRQEFDEHKAIDFDPKDSINNLILLYASTKSYRNIGLHLLEQDAPDVLALYFEWIDAVGHLFVLHSPPKLPDIPDDEYRKFGDAVEQSYVVQDEILGDFMDRMGDETVLMVISDHGFKTGTSRLKNRPEIWAGNAAKWHRPNGMVAFFGKGIKKGYTIRDASIMDVAPTVLALQGLPRVGDMPGRILSDAFEESLKQELNPNTVATLERERGEEVQPSSVGYAENAWAMKKLEALGYLTPDNADAHNNLGQRYQERGEYLKAVEEYKKAIALRPDLHTAYNNIAVCYGELGRLEEAERALLKTIELKPDDFYAMNNLAVTYMHTERMDDARRMAELAVRTEPGYVNGRVTLGSIYAMTGELQRAEQQFLAALELEPDAPQAVDNLQKVRRQMKLNQSKPGNSGE